MSGCDMIHRVQLLLYLFRRPDIVAMETAVAMNRLCDGANHRAKPLRYPDFLSGARIERRQNRASFVSCPFPTNPNPSDRECPETGALFPVVAAFHRWSRPVDAV